MTTDAVPGEAGSSPAAPVQVTDRATLESHLEAHDVVLVEFYADWCGPCQLMEPVVGGLAANTDAAVLTVDVDAARALATEFDVTGLPTIVVFVDGQKTEALVGACSHDELEALLAGYTE